jgi:hypothetical protein
VLEPPMRPVFVAVLCFISAAIGAGINHYWDNLPWFAGTDKVGLRSSIGPNAPEAKPATANPSGGGRDEVLGDRVRCDVRYQELKLPESEYRAFFDKCMGNTVSTTKSE